MLATREERTSELRDIMSEDVLRALLSLDFKSIVFHLSMYIYGGMFGWAEPVIRYFEGEINCGTSKACGQTLLDVAISSGDARMVKLLIEMSDPPDLDYVDEENDPVPPIHKVVRRTNYKEGLDILEMLDAFEKSGHPVDMNARIPERWMEQHVNVLDWFDRTNIPEDARIILQCMRMGAWEVSPRIYERAEHDSLFMLIIKRRRWNLISSRRTALVLKMKSRGSRKRMLTRRFKGPVPTMRTRVPKELWMRLIQMLSEN